MVDVIFLFETLVDSNKIEELRVYLRFEGAFAINNVGRSGGLAVIWRTPNVVSVNKFSNNFIDVMVNLEGDPSWRLTGYYGFPESRRRR